MNTQPFSQTGQMTELCCEYLSVRSIWSCLVVMSHTSFRVNLYSIVRLNIKELLAWSRCYIWRISDSNGIWTHNHLVHKWTLNHKAKLAKWLSCAVSTYLHNASDCMLSSYHIQVSEWIYTLSFSECQGTLAQSRGHIWRISNSSGIKLTTT